MIASNDVSNKKRYFGQWNFDFKIKKQKRKRFLSTESAKK